MWLPGGGSSSSLLGDMSQQEPTKICRKCGETKPVDAFFKQKAAKDGLQYRCRECARLAPRADPTNYNAKYYQANRDRILEKKRAQALADPNRIRQRQAKWRAENPGKAAAKRVRWYRQNADRARELSRNWKKNNPWYNTVMHAQRRAARLRASVAWADRRAMAAIYREARRRTEMFDAPYHVDHVIPLISPDVCGLHCEANLQILSAGRNLSKKNKLLPEYVTY